MCTDLSRHSSQDLRRLKADHKIKASPPKGLKQGEKAIIGSQGQKEEGGGDDLSALQNPPTTNEKHLCRENRPGASHLCVPVGLNDDSFTLQLAYLPDRHTRLSVGGTTTITVAEYNPPQRQGIKAVITAMALASGTSKNKYCS